MTIDYSIINISEKRIDNVNKIESNIYGTRHFPESCDYLDKESRRNFGSRYPNYNEKTYASSPMVLFDKYRRGQEIGCWLSHISIWDYVINNNIDEMLILEDDVILTKTILKNVIDIKNKSSADLLMFGQYTSGYFINKKSASILKEKSEEGFTKYPVDLYIFYCIANAIIYGQVGPILSLQDQTIELRK
jgi:hypothetical protein